MKIKDFLIVTLLTLISPFIHGYYYGFIDHDFYLPYVNKILNPTLYQNDYMFSQGHWAYSPFNYFIVFLKKIIGLDLAGTDFLLYFITLWLLYLAIYSLAKTIYKKDTIAFLAVFLFIVPKWAAQIGHMTHQFYFVSRDLSLALSLLALNCILRQKFISSFFLILAATFTNLSIPIPVGLLWAWLWLKKQKKLPLFALINLNQNQTWLETLRDRGTYSFPHLWRWTGWGNFGLFLSLLGTAWLVLKDKLFSKYAYEMKLFLKICAGVFLFNFVITAIVPIIGLIQLQLVRTVNFIFIIALITFAAATYRLITFGRWQVKLLALLAITGVYFWGDHLTGWHFVIIWALPAILILFPRLLKLKSRKFSHLNLFLILVLLVNLFIKLLIIKPQVFWPYYFHYPNVYISVTDFPNWLATQVWAKQNTPPETVFLTPPNFSGFRSFSQRSIVGDGKDGAVVFYTWEYTRLWQDKMEVLKNYTQFRESDFLKIQQQYPFQYLLVTSNHPVLDFQLVYKNSDFLVYKI
ncbi:hypothetical protein KKE48_02190 [Patescibacteria group bacterium]|nr:hypothetical protein [Patescibacteria group bacterium]MBU1499653.1 hypothetical protein [Patescibacteria group bacterium]